MSGPDELRHTCFLTERYGDFDNPNQENPFIEFLIHFGRHAATFLLLRDPSLQGTHDPHHYTVVQANRIFIFFLSTSFYFIFFQRRNNNNVD
jgi:hypothetical protein